MRAKGLGRTFTAYMLMVPAVCAVAVLAGVLFETAGFSGRHEVTISFLTWYGHVFTGMWGMVALGAAASGAYRDPAGRSIFAMFVAVAWLVAVEWLYIQIL